MQRNEIDFCLDGRWLVAGEMAFAPTSSLVAQGEGWFETLRVENGRPMFLGLHLDRLVASIASAHGEVEAAHALRAVERCLLTMQSRFDRFATGRLRLLLTRDAERTQGENSWQALGEWGEYRADELALAAGIDVTVASFAHPQLGFLGKSASYHWSWAARQEAGRRQASEALLARDGQLLEGASGALVWGLKGRWFVAESAAILPSVTVAALRRAGIDIGTGTLALEWLQPNASETLSGLMLVSALRLAMPIRSCDGLSLPSSTAVAAEWRQALLALHRSESPS